MAKDRAQPKWERAVVTHADCPPDHAPGYGLTLRLEYPDGTVRYVAVAVNGMTARFEEYRRNRTMRLMVMTAAAVVAVAGLASAAPAREVLATVKVVDVWPGQAPTAWQAVIDVQRTVDTSGWDVVMRLHAGEHGPIAATGALVGGGQLVIQGEPGTVINGGQLPAVAAYRGATVLVSDVELRGAAGAILAADRSRVQVGRNVVVGAGGIQVKAAQNASVNLTSPYAVTAPGVVHIQAQGHSTVSVQGAPTFWSAASYTSAVLVATQAEILFTSGFLGQPSGRSADVRFGALLYTAGAALPGAEAPIVVDGGVWR